MQRYLKVKRSGFSGVSSSLSGFTINSCIIKNFSRNLKSIPKIKSEAIDSQLNNKTNTKSSETTELNSFTLDDLKNKKINLSSNFYLQIMSCLSKSTDDIEIKKKLIDILSKNKIEINDESLSKMLNLSKNENNEPNEQLQTMIDGIINEELSEEEFARENGKQIIFKRPPHSLEELKDVFHQSEKIYEENKPYLLQNDEQITAQITDDFFKKIPINFILRSLSYPVTNTDIVLCGVRKISNIHSLFLSDILYRVDPDQIVIQQSPDDPIFIDSNLGSYDKGKTIFYLTNLYYIDWESFLKKARNSNFAYYYQLTSLSS